MPVADRGTSVTEHELRIAARPETVFEYFTDPAKLVEWMGVEAILDPRPGGVFRLVFHPAPSVVAMIGELEAGEPNVVLGEFVEVVPYSRIAFTWGYERRLFSLPPQATAVEVALEPEGDGTILRLTHRGLPAEATAFHRVGWEHYLARLALLGAGHQPGTDPLQAG
jgi:uncharacterized protein YndB with AHSA1/START domain